MDKWSLYQVSRVLTIHSLHTAFHQFYDKGYDFKGEVHNFWELVFISEGSAVIAKDDRIFTLDRGNIAFHPPMEFHRIWSEDSAFRLLVISFSADSSVLEKLSEGVFVLNIAQQERLVELVEDIRKSFFMHASTAGSTGASLIAMQQAVTGLELLLLDILKMESTDKTVLKTHSAQEFSRVIEIMNGHIDENLSVPELAKLSNLGLSNLKKIFQMYAGTGVGKYFLKLKMNRAIHLLENGMSVSEVSEQLGFSTQSYFSYAFRRETGRAPKAFKETPALYENKGGSR